MGNSDLVFAPFRGGCVQNPRNMRPDCGAAVARIEPGRVVAAVIGRVMR